MLSHRAKFESSWRPKREMGCRAKAGDMIYDENICLLRDGRGGAEFLAVKPTISLKPKKVDRRLPCYLS